MGARILGKSVAAIVGALMAFAFVAVFALPQQAMAGELAAGELSTGSLSSQASPDGNTSLATALELPYGKTYTGTFDYADNTTNYEDYWFKFRTSNRDSVYEVQLDSVNAKSIRMYIYDANGNSPSWANTAGWTYIAHGGYDIYTSDRVTTTNSTLDKNAWYYVKVNHNSAIRYNQYRVTVYEKRILSPENLSISPTSYKYDGTAKKPAVTVTYDGVKLVKDADYYVDYYNYINAGSGTVKITGMGDNYAGEVSKTYAIDPIVAKPTIKLSRTSYVYDGYEHKPDIIVRTGSEVLSEDQYTVTYPDNPWRVGTYRVTVTCDGNYKGTATATCTIKPKGTTLTSVSKLKRGFKATWQISDTSGYQIQYSTSKAFKNGTKTATVKDRYTTSKTVKKLAPKKKYYVRVRTYADASGAKVYSAWSSTKSVKTK